MSSNYYQIMWKVHKYEVVCERIKLKKENEK